MGIGTNRIQIGTKTKKFKSTCIASAFCVLRIKFSEISRWRGIWNVCLAANVKYCSFVAMWNKICPRSRSEHFTRVIAFHTLQAYFTCPQGQISLKKALAIASAFFSEICPCGQVKYACSVWNAITRVKCSLRERGQILFHIATKEQYFTFAARQTFHIPRQRDISLNFIRKTQKALAMQVLLNFFVFVPIWMRFVPIPMLTRYFSPWYYDYGLIFDHWTKIF